MVSILLTVKKLNPSGAPLLPNLLRFQFVGIRLALLSLLEIKGSCILRLFGLCSFQRFVFYLTWAGPYIGIRQIFLQTDFSSLFLSCCFSKKFSRIATHHAGTNRVVLSEIAGVLDKPSTLLHSLYSFLNDSRSMVSFMGSHSWGQAFLIGVIGGQRYELEGQRW